MSELCSDYKILHTMYDITKYVDLSWSEQLIETATKGSQIDCVKVNLRMVFETSEDAYHMVRRLSMNRRTLKIGYPYCLEISKGILGKFSVTPAVKASRYEIAFWAYEASCSPMPQRDPEMEYELKVQIHADASQVIYQNETILERSMRLYVLKEGLIKWNSVRDT